MQCIKDFGTTDNYNTDMFEHLHIDFAKKGWRASNKRNETPQMITWLERQEKVASVEHMIEQAREEKKAERLCIAETEQRHLLAQLSDQPDIERRMLRRVEEDNSKIVLAKNCKYNCPTFTSSLITFLTRISKIRSRLQLLFLQVNIYKKVKLIQEKVDEQDDENVYMINATPLQQDTVVVLVSQKAESAGLRGKSF